MLNRKAEVYNKQQETLKLIVISSKIVGFFVCLANQNTPNSAIKINIVDHSCLQCQESMIVIIKQIPTNM